MRRFLVSGILTIGLAHLAFGALGYELEITDGTNFIIVSASGLTTMGSVVPISFSNNTATGVFSYDGGVGNYVVNVSTGEGSPLLSLGSLDLNSVDTSGVTSGPLKIWWSENGITATNTGWLMMWGGTLSTGAGGNVSDTAYEDNTNAFFGMQNTINTIGPQGPGVVGGTAGGGVSVTLVPHSLSELITLNGVGATNYSGNASLTPVPEPATVVLFGGVVLAIATAIKRKVVKKV